jgi:hypothetical protein
MPLANDGSPIDRRTTCDRSVTPVSTRWPCFPVPADHPAAHLARARGIRLVTTDPNEDPKSSWVAIDDHCAGRRIGSHLASWAIETSSWWWRPIGRPAARRHGSAWARYRRTSTPLGCAACRRPFRER